MPDDPIPALDAFYAYGYKGRNMIAIAAPFAMSGETPEILGREVAINGDHYEVLGISRQISGKIHKGEPIGLEVRPTSKPSQAGGSEPAGGPA
ncbi:MAG: hypothetical protein WAK03_11800 [Methylocystis sp.]|jgi:hypothetical protein